MNSNDEKLEFFTENSDEDLQKILPPFAEILEELKDLEPKVILNFLIKKN